MHLLDKSILQIRGDGCVDLIQVLVRTVLWSKGRGEQDKAGVFDRGLRPAGGRWRKIDEVKQSCTSRCV